MSRQPTDRMSIHPSAIVDPGAELHPSVEVGPFSIIEADVRIGEGTVLDSGVRIQKGTTIGRENRIHHGVILGGLPQHLTFDTSVRTELLIGDNNTFREYANVHRASLLETPTRIGNRNYIMGAFHIGHDCEVGDDCIFTHGSLLAGHVIVGNRVFISGVVGVHQFCRIGSFAIIGGCTKVTEDVPPFCMANGVPGAITGINSIGLRRAGFDKEQFRAIKAAFRALFRSGLGEKAALEQLDELAKGSADVAQMRDFVKASERGIMRYAAEDE